VVELEDGVVSVGEAVKGEPGHTIGLSSFYKLTCWVRKARCYSLSNFCRRSLFPDRQSVKLAWDWGVATNS